MTQYQIDKVLENFDLFNFIQDSDKHFYATMMQNGFKICECSSCQILLRPILIKESRKSKEYEELHKAYLGIYAAPYCSNVEQQQNGLNRMHSNMAPINTISGQ